MKKINVFLGKMGRIYVQNPDRKTHSIVKKNDEGSVDVRVIQGRVSRFIRANSKKIRLEDGVLTLILELDVYSDDVKPEIRKRIRGLLDEAVWKKDEVLEVK